MTFPWQDKSQNREEGMITAVGEGSANILLHFRPDTVDFEVDDSPTDPTPLSNHPAPLDRVKLSIVHANKKAQYHLVFKWNVFGTKYIKWVVTG